MALTCSYLIVFLLGLIIGSFLNCLIYRLEISSSRPNALERSSRSTRSFLIGRSFCPHCKHILSWQDLIPIFSFLILKGKCRYCQQKISWQYPLVELATAILFVLAFQLTANSEQLTVSGIINFCYLLIVICFLLVIFVYDLKHYLILNKIIYPAILVSGIWYLVSGIFFHFYNKYEILNIIYGAFGAAGFFLIIFLISKGRWLGFGDIPLVFFMGLFLGFPNILIALFLATFLGAIIGLGLVILGKKKLSSEIPFGPFLVTGTFLALFLGQKIIDWYIMFL